MSKRNLPPGVYFDPRTGHYPVKVRIGGKLVPLGTFHTVEEAAQRAAAARKSREARKTGRNHTTFRSWAEKWLEDRKAASVRDTRGDEQRLRTYAWNEKWADYPLRDLRDHHLRAWLYDLERRQATKPSKGGRVATGEPIKVQTIRNALNAVRACLRDAVRAGRLRENPAEKLQPQRRDATSTEHAVYLTPEQIDALLALPGLPLRLRTIYTVAIYTGMRSGELWGLHWEDVHLDGERPEVAVRYSYDKPTKGGRTRRVPLMAPARAALRAWKDAYPAIGKALVFPTGWTRDNDSPRCPEPRMAHDSYDAEWGTWAPKAGVALPFKNLRHTCGSHLVMGTWGAPVPMIAVKKWLGHQSITTTERHYAHLAPEALHSVRVALDAVPKTVPKAKGRSAVSMRNRGAPGPTRTGEPSV